MLFPGLDAIIPLGSLFSPSTSISEVSSLYFQVRYATWLTRTTRTPCGPTDESGFRFHNFRTESDFDHPQIYFLSSPHGSGKYQLATIIECPAGSASN